MIKVTIERIETVVKSTNTYQRLWDNPPANGDRQYGYVEADVPTEQTTMLLLQFVPELDLPAVIKAINGL